MFEQELLEKITEEAFIDKLEKLSSLSSRTEAMEDALATQTLISADLARAATYGLNKLSPYGIQGEVALHRARKTANMPKKASVNESIYDEHAQRIAQKNTQRDSAYRHEQWLLDLAKRRNVSFDYVPEPILRKEDND